MGSVFGCESEDRVHCRVLGFAMLNIQASQFLVGMFVIVEGLAFSEQRQPSIISLSLTLFFS
jgi:hypothetical protein